MVNIEQSREKILNMLKEAKKPVSGTQLGKAAGISRVAVWKHIKSLSDCGYEISSDRQGYTLSFSEKNSDVLSPFEIPLFSRKIRSYRQVDTTMSKAREFALAGAEDMSIVTAERQSAGRGSRSNSWESERGGLYFTIILRPKTGIQLYNIYTLASAAAAADALGQAGIECTTVWPNDVYSKGRKISGILSEVYGTSGTIDFILVGVGINVNNKPASGIAAKEIKGESCSRPELLRYFLASFNRLYGKTSSDITSAWYLKSARKDGRVSVNKNGSVVSGTVAGITEEGNLLLETGKKDSKKEIIRIFPGDETIEKKGLL